MDGMYREGVIPGTIMPNSYDESLILNAQQNGGNVFDDWFFPSDKERRQMGQQLIMDRLEPKQRMEGLKAAGINPLTAAAGVAGTASNSPTPASSVNPIGDVAGAVGSAADGFGAVAGGIKSIEEAKVVGELAQNEIDVGNAQIDKWSHDNGFTDEQTEAFVIDNQTRSAMNRAELLVKRQQWKNMRIDADRIRSQRDYVDKQVKWYDEQISAEIDLSKKRALESEKHALQIEEQTKTERMENDFCEKFGYRRGEPFDNAMVDLWFQGEYDKVKDAQNFMYSYKYNSSYNEEEGIQTAIEKHAYSIANSQQTAASLNQIITDWNQPSSGLWSMLEKSLRISRNGKGLGVDISDPIAAKSNVEAYSQYTSMLVALNLNLDSLDKEIQHYSSQNEFGKVRELTIQRNALMKFIQEYTFDKFIENMAKAK